MSDLPGLRAPNGWLEAIGLSPAVQVRIFWSTTAALCLTFAVRQLTGNSGRPKADKSNDFNSFLKKYTELKKNQPKPASTSFDAFLKERKPVPVATSFDAFLKDSSPSAAAEPVEESIAQAYAGPSEDQAVVTVIFGTEYGFAQEIAEKLCSKLLESTKYWEAATQQSCAFVPIKNAEPAYVRLFRPRLLDMADHPEGADLQHEQALLLVCSTQGDGVPPGEARGFCNWLSSSAAPQLPTACYSVCALGDTSYTHFCACGKQLDSSLANLRAKQFVPRKDVNREDWKAVDSWMTAVLDGLEGLGLRSVKETGYSLVSPCGSQQARISKSRPFMAAVVAAEGLCKIKSSADKDTIRVEIDIGESGLEYDPGDALGIYASNAPEVVNDLLECVDADPEELHILPAWHYSDEARPAGSKISLREMLAHCYDLRTPRRELLQQLLDSMPAAAKPQKGLQNGVSQDSNAANGFRGAAQSNGHTNGTFSHHSQAAVSQNKQAARLEELLKGTEEALDAYLELRHVVDVLQDFSHGKLTLQGLLKGLRPLQPRLYSISSSRLEAPTRVQVTVAVVRYASLAKERLGVASTFLAERIQVGEKLPVYVSKNPDFGLPSDPTKPIIMVGPGTGLAPFRAFMMERVLGGCSFGESLLFFGCRRRDQDYLYDRLLEQWAEQGVITLRTAFSREQGHKVYVQDRLRESGSKVWQLLQSGGHFYICGDAAHMAAAVERALLEVLGEELGGEKAATGYLEQLKREERFQRDVWF